MIHQLSDRRAYPFVAVNCGAIQDTLFEREFFGHRKGAFTGADRNSPGLFETAHQGILFLDEIPELKPDQQVKLLRVLQSHEYLPVGSSTPKTADVRIISATNKDLKTLLAQGLIRKDFFYRIHVITINLPPLREHKEDLPLLIEHFLRQYGMVEERPLLPSHILNAFYAYHWPGNIRELENELQRYLTIGRLGFLDSGAEQPDEEAGLNLPLAMSALEKRYILQALEQTQGHREQTAALLGIDRKTLYRKLKKFGLE